jgi:hypothetical protein
MPEIADPRRSAGHRPVRRIVIEHAAPPDRGMQCREAHPHAVGLVEQRDVTTGLGEVGAAQDGTVVPDIVIAGDDHGRAGDTRQLLDDEIDDRALDPIVIEQIAGDQEQVGPAVAHDVDDTREGLAHFGAVGTVMEVNVGGVGDTQRSNHWADLSCWSGAVEGSSLAGGSGRLVSLTHGSSLMNRGLV